MFTVSVVCLTSQLTPGCCVFIICISMDELFANERNPASTDCTNLGYVFIGRRIVRVLSCVCLRCIPDSVERAVRTVFGIAF